MKWIKPSAINGTVHASPSKSMTIRATAMSLLCRGKSQLHHYSVCDDALAGIGIAKSLGAEMKSEKSCLHIMGGGPFQETTLDCVESGLCMRMFTPIAGLFNTEMTLIGTRTILKRPMGMMEQPLEQLGACFRTSNGFPPIRIHGPLRGGKVRIDGSLGSQFLTGLLISLPLCRADSEVTVDNLKSKPYVRMTLSLLQRFGIVIDHDEALQQFHIPGNQLYKHQSVPIEGDWSGAGFLLVAGAINSKVSIRNLQLQSCQADRRILSVLESANARVSVRDDEVTVEKSDLKAFQYDATESPDLFPPIAVLACFCQGRSMIQGAERLRYKESNRADALMTELTRIGAKITVEGDRMAITGTQLSGGMFGSHGDHRLAMAGAIAGLNSVLGVGISGWDCISKSYPNFFKDLKSIGGDVR